MQMASTTKLRKYTSRCHYNTKDKLNQSHKTTNIPHFTPVKKDPTHKQGGGRPNYIKNNTSLRQLSY